MSKKKDKMLKKMEKTHKTNTDKDIDWTIERIYQNADNLRTISGVSQDFNELSEAYDAVLNIVMSMKKKDVQLLGRYI